MTLIPRLQSREILQRLLSIESELCAGLWNKMSNNIYTFYQKKKEKKRKKSNIYFFFLIGFRTKTTRLLPLSNAIMAFSS